MTPYQSKRESLSRDDANLLIELVKIAIRSESINGVSADRIEFLIAKLKRLEK